MKKVLIACPTADVKQYCMDDYMDNVASFTYPNTKLFLVDNSNLRDFYTESKKKYSSKFGDWFEMARVSPMQYSEFKFALAKSHDLCREKVLDEDFDYLLHLESDIFPPSDIIERLLDSNKKVVGAMYHIELGDRSTLMIQQLEDFGWEHRETYNLDETDISFVDGTVKKVFSCGLGCVLIHKSVLKKVKFRTEPNSPVHPDSFFFADLDSKGIPVHVDTSIYCKHRNHSTIRF